MGRGRFTSHGASTSLNVESAANSSDDLLAGSATFTGAWEDVNEYTTVAVAVLGSLATDGTLYFDLSTDNGATFTSVPSTVSDTTFAVPRILNVVEQYVRIRYVNGTTPMTGNFSLTTKYSNGQELALLSSIEGIVKGETPTQVVRSITTGKDPDGTYGNQVVSGVDSGNSSVTNLTAATSLVFTGTWCAIDKYAGITTLVDGTAGSAVSGTLQMQFSHNGSTVHRSINTINADVANVLPRTLGVVAKYFRVIYTSDGDLNSFDIQTMLHTEQVTLVSRLDQTLQGTEDVLLTRDATNFNLDVARRHVAGQRAFFFFGFNNDVGSTSEDIHPIGGNVNWLTTATKVEVSSTHTDDTSAGAGVRSVEIHGLSATGVDQDEVIIMNGTNAVESSLTYIRLNKMHNETVGTYGGSHRGDVTCQVTGGGVILAKMTGAEGAVDSSVQYGSGEAGNGHWSVPLGKVLYITRIQVIPDVGTNKTIDIALYEREGILKTSAPYDPRRVIWAELGVDTSIDKVFQSHIKIKALADIWFRAKGTASPKIAVWLDFYLVDADSSGA